MGLKSMSDSRGMVMARMLALVLLAVGVAGLIGGGFLAWHSFQERSAMQRAGQHAERLAGALAAQVKTIRGALAGEQIQAVLVEEAWQSDDLRTVLRDQQVTNVLNLAVATGPIEEVDLSAFPGGGFAVLEMMLQARTEGAVPAQVHFARTSEEYFAVAEPVVSGDVPPVVVLATFPVSVLVNRVRESESSVAIRLRQQVDGNPASLAEIGGLFTAPQGSVPIAGTLLRLEWARTGVLSPLNNLQLASVLGISLLALILAMLLLRRTAPAQAKTKAREQVAARPAPPKPHSLPDDSDWTEVLATPRPGHPVQIGDATDLGSDPGPQTESAPAGAEEPESDSPPRPAAAARKDLEGFLGDEMAPPDKTSAPTPSASPEVPTAIDEDDEINRMLAALIDEDANDDAGEEQVSAQEPAGDSPPGVPEQPVQPAAEKRSGEPAVVAESSGMPPASIFRAYDIRGVVGDTLSPDIALAIGRAIGSEARDLGLTRIAVARDGRLSGAEMLAGLIRGLVACGMEVIEVGAVPTPVLYYAAQELAGGSGVMVTGSHNPPDYNGFKIVLGGETLSGERIQALHQRLREGRLVDGAGEVRQQQIVSRYMERIGTDIQLEKPLKVVVDCGNGIAGAIAPKLLEAIGAEVIPLYAEVDGTFPNHHPDPGDPETLEDLKLCVRNFNADLGVAFDGDGDRLGVVAPDGEIIYPDRIMMLFARDVLSRNPGRPIIFDVKCSSLLAGEIEKAGGKPIMGRTGHSFIKKQLKDDNAVFAGEMSGHFFFAERWYGFDDGIYAAARLLEILAADTRATGQILAELPKAVSTPELKVEMKEGEPHPFVKAFKYSAEFEGATLNTIDGVRADFEDGFGLVRASNTTPVLVCRFEGKDARALQRIKDQFREAMLKINPALKLPF